MGLVPGMTGQPVRARGLDLDRHLGNAVQRHAQRAATVHAGPGLARRVLDLQWRVALGREPRLGDGPAREDLVAGHGDERPGRVGGPQRRQWLREAPPASGALSSSSLITASVAWYSPSPKCTQRKAPPLPHRKSDGQPWHP